MTELPRWQVEGRPKGGRHYDAIGGTVTSAERPVSGQDAVLDDGRRLRVVAVSMTDDELAAARHMVRRVAERHDLDAEFLGCISSYGVTTLSASLWNRAPGVHPWYRRVANYQAWNGRWSTSNGVELAAERELDAYLDEYSRDPRSPNDVLGAIRHRSLREPR